MQLLIFYLIINTLFLTGAFSEIGPDIAFTKNDMWTLSQKITRSLRKCKPMRRSPEVIIEVQNATTEFINKTQFSELIHSMLEGKTHAKPATEEPEYEIRAKLEFQKPLNPLTGKPSYTLTAQVFQAEEKLCEKKVKISKNIM